MSRQRAASRTRRPREAIVGVTVRARDACATRTRTSPARSRRPRPTTHGTGGRSSWSPTAWAATRPARWPAGSRSRRRSTGGAGDAGRAAAGAAERVSGAANVAVYDAATEPGRRGMGTTIVAATLAGHEAIVGHVGDSRAYLVHGDDCVQLTADHSRVGEMVRMRMITPEEAAKHPARSQLTRSLGAEAGVQVDLTRQAVEAGDSLVLCTDGLWDLVSRLEMAEVLHGAGGGGGPSEADARGLARGTRDRSGGHPITSPQPSSPSRRRCRSPPLPVGGSSDEAGSDMRFAPGSHVDQFEIVEELGEGAYAETYKARDTTSGTEVVLKLINPQLFADPQNFAALPARGEDRVRARPSERPAEPRQGQPPDRALPRPRVRRRREPTTARGDARSARSRSRRRSTGVVSSPTRSSTSTRTASCTATSSPRTC